SLGSSTEQLAYETESASRRRSPERVLMCVVLVVAEPFSAALGERRDRFRSRRLPPKPIAAARLGPKAALFQFGFGAARRRQVRPPRRTRRSPPCLPCARVSHATRVRDRIADCDMRLVQLVHGLFP